MEKLGKIEKYLFPYIILKERERDFRAEAAGRTKLVHCKSHVQNHELDGNPKAFDKGLLMLYSLIFRTTKQASLYTLDLSVNTKIMDYQTNIQMNDVVNSTGAPAGFTMTAPEPKQR